MGEDIMVNRAPVLTLWAAVVAERLGYDHDAALTLGKCLAGLNAQSKGRALGICAPPKVVAGRMPQKVGLGEEFWLEICGRALPAKRTSDGIRAVVKGKPIGPASVQQYLEQKFGDNLSIVRDAMSRLADSFQPKELESLAYSLYEQFRPQIPSGRGGWGAKGTLDLAVLRSLHRG